MVSAIFILLFFLFYASSGLVAAGKLFESVFALDYKIAVVVGTIAVVSYTFVGGFLAVAWTDVVPGLTDGAGTGTGAGLCPECGGWCRCGTCRHAGQEPGTAYLFFTDVKGEPLGSIAILSLLGCGARLLGQPHILARFKAEKLANDKDMPTARRIAVSWTR